MSDKNSNNQYKTRYEELKNLKLKEGEVNLYQIALNLKIKTTGKNKHDLILNIIMKENELREKSIKEQKEKKFSETECPVCFEEFETNFTPLEPCGHFIHIECVKKTNKMDCPLCRQHIIDPDIEVKKTIKTFLNIFDSLRSISNSYYDKNSFNIIMNELASNQFIYILSNLKFVEKHPSFKNIVLKKAKEFQNDILCNTKLRKICEEMISKLTDFSEIK
jgi:hypothetical protein